MTARPLAPAPGARMRHGVSSQPVRVEQRRLANPSSFAILARRVAGGSAVLATTNSHVSGRPRHPTGARSPTATTEVVAPPRITDSWSIARARALTGLQDRVLDAGHPTAPSPSVTRFGPPGRKHTQQPAGVAEVARNTCVCVHRGPGVDEVAPSGYVRPHPPHRPARPQMAKLKSAQPHKIEQGLSILWGWPQTVRAMPQDRG